LRNQFHLWSAHCSLLDGDRAACLEMLGRIDHDGTSGAIASLIEAQLAEKSGPALAAIDSALTLDPDVGFVNYMAGVLYARLKRWKKTEAALRRAIEIDPVFQPAHDLLARVLTVRGKRNEAVDAALAGLEIDNSSAASQFTLGLALHFAGERTRAAAAFGRARHFRRTS
jgi:tetratricopeptide (TPR) repeat protein